MPEIGERNGAQLAIATLAGMGVELCLTNPGTSELHLVDALAHTPQIKTVLGLFEGVVTGAADGYARMAGKPAMTLLHLGPGLANGLANLHNARRARTPLINVVGQHALDHLAYDAPLTSDVAKMAATVSARVESIDGGEEIAAACQKAWQTATSHPGGVATLIFPADIAWSPAPEQYPGKAPVALGGKKTASDEAIGSAVEVLRSGEPALLLVGGSALGEAGIVAAGRIRAASGAGLATPTFNGRLERGAGRVALQKIPYFGDAVRSLLAGYKHLILVEATPPVSFFGYPGSSGWLTPKDCRIHMLASENEDGTGALESLAEALSAPQLPEEVQERNKPDLKSGPLSPEAIGAALAHYLPEGAIVSDEAITAGLAVTPMTAGARPHTWLDLTGGSIGQGIPLATGAALASGDRKVVALAGDGSALYTIQALWTQARENLDVTTIIFANRNYAILKFEQAGLFGPAGVVDGGVAAEIDNPEIGFVDLARGFGVEAARAETAEEFTDLFASSMKRRGPFLIEASYSVAGL
ncbi:MAG: acetolactate synthase large subunit [Sphingomonadales bacterium]